MGHLKKLGFVTMTANASILINYEKSIMIRIYVDDVITATKKLQLLEELEVQLIEEFEVKFLEDVNLILGMVVKKDLTSGILHLNHAYYIRDFLDTYNITTANPVATPMIKGSSIPLGKGEDSEFDVTDYQR